MIQMLVINDTEFKSGEQVINNISFNVTVVDDPLKALNQIIHSNPDAIVINMENPGMDASKVVKRIRNMQASKETPLMMCVDLDKEATYKEMVRTYSNSYYFTLPITHYEIFDWAIKTLGVVQPSQQKSVLVVDDDPVVLDITRMFLGAKYSVITASSASEALRILADTKPNVILLDIAMPDMDGKELYRSIRGVEDCESIPILFQTGMAGVNTVKECVKLGAAGFVVKPVQKQILLNRIDECIQASKGKKKLLYVFEEFDFMYSLIAGYAREDFEVARGESLLQSLNHLEEVNPDIILVDMDNSAFILNRTREKANELHIPIVIMTRDMNSSQAMKEKQRLNTSFVPLPLVRDSLLEVLKNIGPWRSEHQ